MGLENVAVLLSTMKNKAVDQTRFSIDKNTKGEMGRNYQDVDFNQRQLKWFERRRFAINRRWSRTFGLLSQVLNQPVWILHRKFYDAF